MKKFGEKLRKLRKSQKMTQKELAAALGISAHSYITKLEKGQKQPSVQMAIKIARLFDVSLDNLLKDELAIKPSIPLHSTPID